MENNMSIQEKFMNMSQDEKTEEQIKSIQMQQSTNQPWLDIRLTTEAMDYLWDDINGKQTDARNQLNGNISKSVFIEDKDNWFYENVVKELTEYLYYKDWNNYYSVHITKYLPPPVFKLYELWVNYQKQHEFNPPHVHSGIFSFVVFMKIPTHWKDQHALTFSANSNSPQASDFQFLFGQGNGHVKKIPLPLCPEDEGRMFFFPAWLTHQVLPFYGTEEERITVSGNIFFPPPEDSKDIHSTGTDQQV